MTEAEVRREDFEHPLLLLRISLVPEVATFVEGLKDLTIELVAKQAAVRQLGRRGQRIVKALYDEMLSDPEGLVPSSAWRLFTPGFGSSADEL